MRQHFPQSSEKDEMLEKVSGQARPARLSPLEREQTHQHCYYSKSRWFGSLSLFYSSPFSSSRG